ncbi:hypothetical protein FQA39_LY13334 [Lamprigera yunnana]|nr:hypothetical protein FQA39_LY13334 [Lamprigera yunnana]
MSFLSPYMEPSTSQYSYQVQNEYNVESQNEENGENMTDDIETRDKDDGDEDRTTSISLSSVPEVSTGSNNHDKPNVCSFSRTSTSKKGIIEKSMTELVDIMKFNNRIRSQIIKPTEPPTVQSDDIDLFFISLAKTVKKLPQNEQVYLKMGLSKLVFEAELRNLSSVTQSQPMTVTMPDPSPAQFSSANSYSNESETFIQSPSAPHYFLHINENSRSTRHCLENTNEVPISTHQIILYIYKRNYFGGSRLLEVGAPSSKIDTTIRDNETSMHTYVDMLTRDGEAAMRTHHTAYFDNGENC